VLQGGAVRRRDTDEGDDDDLATKRNFMAPHALFKNGWWTSAAVLRHNVYIGSATSKASFGQTRTGASNSIAHTKFCL